MWCHLCIKDYPDFEDFRNHIIRKHQNSSEICQENSDSEESEHVNAEASEVDNEDGKSDDSMDSFKFSAGIGYRFNKNRKDIGASALSTSQKEMDVNAGTSDLKEITSKKSPKKYKKPLLKKRIGRKKIKVVFGKRVLPKRKKLSFNQVETSKYSENDETDQSERFVKTDDTPQENLVSQSLFKNNYPSLSNSNYATPQSMSNNNPVVILNPYAGQSMSNYVIGNQATQAQPPFYVINPVVPKSASSKTEEGFNFSSGNILKWLDELKVLCKNIKFPLPPSLFNTVKTVHKTIFDIYCRATINKEARAVMKVYEELDCMIHKHINYINNTISEIRND